MFQMSPSSARICTRLGVFLVVLGAGVPMGLAVATGVAAPWLMEQGATPASIGGPWRTALLLAGGSAVLGTVLTLAGQWFNGTARRA